MMTIPAVALEHASFGYEHSLTLEDITLRVMPGELLGLIGPNGAGKSTLLKLIARLILPAAGSVAIQGTSVARLREREIARRIAVVPQDFAVQFAYTVRQIVALGRMPHQGTWQVERAEDRAVVTEALAATGLSAFADRPFNALSGGERQRVLIALALAQAAPILLLDEPTAHLDIKHQVELLDLMRQINQQRGTTIIATLHDLNLAARHFPRLALLHRRIIADGPPSAVLQTEVLQQVYATPVRVGIPPGETHLTVLPPGAAALALAQGRDPIHVIAGGGSGALVMRALAEAGIPFTAGPFAQGDSDGDLARRLGAATVELPPFTPITTAARDATRAMLRQAHGIVVCQPGVIAQTPALRDLVWETHAWSIPIWIMGEADGDDLGVRAEYIASPAALITLAHAAAAGPHRAETGIPSGTIMR
jgi:iron complex transport system ATP-binding protein